VGKYTLQELRWLKRHMPAAAGEIQDLADRVRAFIREENHASHNPSSNR